MRSVEGEGFRGAAVLRANEWNARVLARRCAQKASGGINLLSILITRHGPCTRVSHGIYSFAAILSGIGACQYNRNNGTTATVGCRSRLKHTDRMGGLSVHAAIEGIISILYLEDKARRA